MTLNGSVAITLRYFTEFGKPALQKTIMAEFMQASIVFLVRVQCRNALLIMEGKMISGVKTRGRPRRAWTDDLKDWTQLRNYSELKRTAEDRTIWNAFARQRST